MAVQVRRLGFSCFLPLLLLPPPSSLWSFLCVLFLLLCCVALSIQGFGHLCIFVNDGAQAEACARFTSLGVQETPRRDPCNTSHSSWTPTPTGWRSSRKGGRKIE